jgi:MFS transporter, OCT family, solute carrier family 22 (organic cation transporter), member 4/5
MSLTGIAQAFSTNYEMFVTFVFLNAIGISGIYPLAFVLGLEMVGKQKRGIAGTVCNYFYSFGIASLGVVAWLQNDYFNLQLLISIPPLILFVYFWIVPESVRWLLAKNQNKRAIKIIKTAAKVNGKEISDETLKKFQELEDAEDNQTAKYLIEAENKKGNVWLAVKEMLSSKVMCLRILILFYNFAINALVYFGLSLHSVSLSGNMYLNFILVSLVEIPGCYFGLVTIEKFGRVPSFIGSMILCGITCVLCGYSETVSMQVTLFLIGKLGITCSFCIIYVHATEMVPTIIRSSCVGFFAAMSRLGALAAPFVPFLDKYYKPLPFIVFGATAIVGGFTYLYLPETLNRNLPNTVEEATRINFQPQIDDKTDSYKRNNPE